MSFSKLHRVILGSMAFVGCGMLVSRCEATPITVPNFSFENGDTGTYSPSDNWTLHIDSASTTLASFSGHESSPPVTGATGSTVAGVYLDHNNVSGNQTPDVPANGSLGTLSNSASLGTFAAKTLYTLTASLGTNGPTGQIQIGLGLGAAPLTLATMSPGNSELFVDSTFGAQNVVDETFTLDTSVYTGLVGQPIYVSLLDLSHYTYGREALFDNVRLDATAVPEPSCLGLLSLAGLVVRRRR